MIGVHVVRLIFVVNAEEEFIVCEDENGLVLRIPRRGSTFEVEEDMALLIDDQNTVSRYEGPFADPEDGFYKHIQWEGGGLILKARRPPLTADELRSLIEELVEGNNANTRFIFSTCC